MSKILWNSLLASPAILGAALAISTAAIAAEAQPTTVEAAQPQVAETQASAANPVTVAAAVTAPEANVTPIFAATSATDSAQPAIAQTTVDAVEPVAASTVKPAETPAQVALTPAQSTTTEAAPAANAPATSVSSLDQVNQYGNEGKASNSTTIAQVTSVSQLSDVQPTDWAFQALQSLVERYGCIVGYPDSTYRGNRALTRYEFAAGLNACMDRVNELIAAGTANLVTKEDLATLQRLQEEFAAELATLRGRVDALEARTAELEANQFSTTTKLVGEAIFAVTNEFNNDTDNKVALQDRVRLDLQTSFTGRDVLHTRLAAGNALPFTKPGGTAEGTQQFEIGSTTDNSINLDWLSYYFPVGQNLQLYVAATGGIHSDYVYSTVNPYFEDFDGGNGALSAFAQESPIYRIGGGAGAAVNFKFGNALAFTGGYLAGSGITGQGILGGQGGGANVPSSKAGLFDGSYAALGQVTFTPSDSLQLGLTYVHGYHNQGAPIFNLGGRAALVGSTFANNSNIGAGVGTAVTNSYGAQLAFKLSPRISLSGFAGYTNANYLNAGSGEVWYYGGGLALPDFGKEGNLLGVFVGVEPYLGGINTTLPLAQPTRDTSLHVEGFYKYRLTDNISITPGVIWITAPNQSDVANNDVVIGTLRTTFNF